MQGQEKKTPVPKSFISLNNIFTTANNCNNNKEYQKNINNNIFYNYNLLNKKESVFNYNHYLYQLLLMPQIIRIQNHSYQ